MQAAELANQFDIPGALHFEDSPGGLTRAVISTPTAEADLYLQGAHLTHWKPRGQPAVLFVSSKSLFVPGKAIRGGVPIIFPWFGPRSDGKAGPAHGFARTLEWSVEGTALSDGGEIEITLTLAPNDATRSLFTPDFFLRYRVTVGTGLKLELETRNNGTEAFTFEEALHTYLAVADISQVSVSGLADTTYIDKTDESKRKTLSSERLLIVEETDQVHLGTKAACLVRDPAGYRMIVVEKTGSDSTVVWNPWIEKTSGMADVAADDWKEMLCVETANAADNAVRLLPGAAHTMGASIRVNPLDRDGGGGHGIE